MAVLFDRIIIAVPNLKEALAQYELLLGASFWLRANAHSVPTAWVALANTVLELQEQPVIQSTIVGFVLSDESTVRYVEVRNLLIGLCDGSVTRQFRAELGGVDETGLRVDHLVLHTTNAEACINIFEKRLGLRLALDKDVPQWGGRMLFFRSGKLTLEVIEPRENKPSQDYFWGIAYQCADIDVFTARLKDQHVAVSSVRDGRKPNTKVATIKSHHLEIPTLLVQPAP
jgi:catechol 2,3-dioxygenase-like lactoylglutathione lyase family enzyme